MFGLEAGAQRRAHHQLPGDAAGEAGAEALVLVIVGEFGAFGIALVADLVALGGECAQLGIALGRGFSPFGAAGGQHAGDDGGGAGDQQRVLRHPGAGKAQQQARRADAAILAGKAPAAARLRIPDEIAEVPDQRRPGHAPCPLLPSWRGCHRGGVYSTRKSMLPLMGSPSMPVAVQLTV